jgi:hypothetical protein
VNHSATPDFWACYRALPSAVRDLADKSFSLLKTNQHHPSLHLKQIGKFWSVRVGLHHRALGIGVDDGLVWFWIGSHSDYDKLVG